MAGVFLGIDVGSTTVKVVVLDEDKALLAQRYRRSHGRPWPTLVDVMDELAAEVDLTSVRGVGLTGSGGASVARLVGGQHVNELIAQTRAAGEYFPSARTIVEIGGQDSKLLAMEWDAGRGAMALIDFAMNAVCAAGTGAFLDQQAERLGIDIEREFGQLALQSSTPARIAGRCTVFAKSDMIHLQQRGTPLPDILAGLCLALARNFRSVIGKGKSFVRPILFQGGVAYNAGVVRAFETVLGLANGELIVPPNHHVMAALGTALNAMDEAAAGRLTPFHGLAGLAGRLATEGQTHSSLAPLRPITFHARPGGPVVAPALLGRAAPPAVYLGVDVGSVSTNVVLVDEAGHVVARRYLPTAGKPLEAVRRGLAEAGQEVGGLVRVLGAGATGSGRYLTADFIGADIVRNEITAQARAAIAMDPTVDTVIEIGGQDSKFIRLDHGAIVDFTMNSACAAGTGAFLEEQAARLSIAIREEFSHRAMASPAPTCLGERCTVFMESDLVHHQQRGATVNDLTAGLAYAIAENYLNRVVNGRPLGSNVFFQGGVAANESVVAAFRQQTGKRITVPPHHDVTGAIGVALLAREAMTQRASGERRPTRFRGFDLTARDYQASIFECKACPNLCEVSKVVIAGEAPIFYGARCDRFEEAGRTNVATTVPDLFAERNALLLGDYAPPDGRRTGRPRIALPRALTFYDLFPYWRAFCGALNVEIVLSEPTNPTIRQLTLDHATAEACYPTKLVYGHVASLLSSGAGHVFLPSVIDREHPTPGQAENNYCPYIPSTAYLVPAALDLAAHGCPALAFPLRMLTERGRRRDLNALATTFGASARDIAAADAAGMAALHDFRTALRARGRQVLASLAPDQTAVVLIGRPYTTADPGVCQDLPAKLRRLGVVPLPMDFLPLETVDISGTYEAMFWHCGQDILAAGTLIRDDPRLQAIYVSSFGCGPDSFLLSFFRSVMAPKPFLELEMDEHTADAGIVTRCEAFLESLCLVREVA